ncbi:MAG TPA: hypothetical protein VIL88_14925 [Devosia sp.]|uniref:hypothetical protein n=1 Tax=Devosia sp. TaxID=1871048 RepID=UPI002F931A41
MTSSQADFAVVGSTPLARLLAGLLASAHGKTVLFLGESHAAYRLPQGIDLSLAPITRPETWFLLQSVMPESLKLIARIGGRGTWSHIDPLLVAKGEEHREALAHVRQMALGFGYGAEPVSRLPSGVSGEGVLLRDAVLLHRAALEAKLDQWLTAQDVRKVPGSDGLVLHADGSGEVSVEGTTLGCNRVVLADDQAVLQHLGEQLPLLRRQQSSTVFAAGVERSRIPLMLQLDTALSILNQPGRGMVATGSGSILDVAEQLRLLVAQQENFQPAGQSSFDTLAATDGAPALGRLGDTAVDVLAGLGPTGAFLAPAIARWLCGSASSTEAAWFEARHPMRDTAASPVAEIGAQP